MDYSKYDIHARLLGPQPNIESRIARYLPRETAVKFRLAMLAYRIRLSKWLNPIDEEQLAKKLARPAFRYHGSKFALADWVMSFFPDQKDYDLWGEPFSGNASVTLRKRRSPLEVINDMDGNVINFFYVLRRWPFELIQAVELTPYAHEEWVKSWKDTDDAVEKARRFFIRSYGSIAGPTAQWNTGWRRQVKLSRGITGNKMTAAAVTFGRIEHLWQVAERLKGVMIERMDAIQLVLKYDHDRALWYFDPPYVWATRGRWSNTAYTHEMEDGDHVQFCEVARTLEGFVIISGYENDIYTEQLEAHGWERIDRDARINGAGKATESLWLNPRLVEYRKQKGHTSVKRTQMTLFQEVDHGEV